ncbi:MAG: hypothetical protein KKD63_10040 [Proteobacteria bacterium]|nr:hypothetical protein [Desulfobulbaceae bacterium]MBU4153211.1 hypothetical protein [Pseudomonadota bacterium]
MSDNSLISLILDSVLKEAMGLNISSIGANSLKHAIGRRMRALEMENTLQYLNLIKKSTPELNELIEEVAVNETWFFRDEAPFIALREYATAFFQQGKNKSLRLLSIPCSTGEEPYSMAMTLIEAGIPAHSFTIDAVDISRRSLEVARQGIYRPNSFRTTYAKRYQGYFSKTRQSYALDKSIKGLIRFHRGNLLHLTPPLTKTTYNVIFCRNLLIYLDSSFHQKAIDTFSALLDDAGLLFIGHAESGIFSHSRFTQAPHPKAFAFYKRPEESEKKSSKYLSGNASANASAFLFKNSVSYANATITHTPTNRYGELDSLDHQIKAHEDQIQKQGPTAESFYQLATIFEQKNEWKSAISMLKKAIYLDPNSIEAIDMLAAIYQRLGDEANYQSCLNRGRRIITRLAMPTDPNI